VVNGVEKGTKAFSAKTTKTGWHKQCDSGIYANWTVSTEVETETIKGEW